MKYGDNKKSLLVKDIVDQFHMNDKSVVSITKQSNEDVLFKGRVDYLQYDITGRMNNLCELQVLSLDVGLNCLVIYV